MPARQKILKSLIPHFEELGFLCFWDNKRQLVIKYDNEFSLHLHTDSWAQYIKIKVYDFQQSNVNYEFDININPEGIAKTKIFSVLKKTRYGRMIK